MVARPAGGKLTGVLRRTLTKSRGLRKIHNRLKNELVGDNALLNTRYVPEEAFTNKIHSVLVGLIERSGRANIGDYLEFGVFNGTSLACVYRLFQELSLDHARLFGFDSFEGLPAEADHEDEGLWLPGQFACGFDLTKRSLTERGVDWSRVFLVKGWFNDTLTPELVERHRLRKASLIMVDCDLYSSAAACLRFVEPFIAEEAIVVFDDWFSYRMADRNLGEARAFREFLERHPEFEATELGGYNDNSLVFSLVRRH